MALKILPFLDALPTVTAQTQEFDEFELHHDHHHRQGTIRRRRCRDAGGRRGGLVGEVIQSFHHTAVVRLVNDGQSKVGVSFGHDPIVHRHG